ncbi:MAG: transglutaminase-like domain-containing protein [Pseudomonadota bacterium]
MRIVALLCALYCSQSLAQLPTLSEIELQRPDNLMWPVDNPLHLEIVVEDADTLMAHLARYRGVTAVKIGPRRVSLSLSQDLVLDESPQDKHSHESFVIDIGETSTQSFVSEFTDDRSESIAASDIEVFVNAYIDDMTYIHGFHIASRVASDRSGDCTEYAVLTTALGRAVGMPSRLIFGIVILQAHDTISAFGHAWTEIFDRGSWRLVDAALHEVPPSSRFYLPTDELRNEGPAFGFSIATSVGTFPHKLTLSGALASRSH